MHIAHRPLAALVLILVLFLTLPAVSAPKPVATVLATMGSNTARLQGASASMPLAIRAALSVGDVVSTDAKGRATLLFSDGSQVRLNGNSRIELSSPSPVGKGKRSLFRVIWGEVWVRLRPGNAVQTRSAIAGARGTEFDLAVDHEDKATLTVTEGEVDFYNECGAVVVSESQQSTAQPGSAPSAPVTVGNAGFIVEWTLDLERAAIPRETPGSTSGASELSARVARYREIVRAHPEDATSHFDYGDALFDSRRFEDCLAEFRESDLLRPDQSATLTRIGDALLELGRLDDSRDAYGRALRVQPAYEPGLLGIAYTELRRGRPVDAEKVARQAADSDPRSAEARIVLGLALMRQSGKSAEARKAFEAALLGSPSECRYQAQAWLALLLLGEDDLPGAVREAEAAKKANNNSALARGNLALVYLFADRSRDAVREARAAAALNPSSVAALVALAQSLLAEGRVDSATRSAAQAVALDPGLSQAHYVLGVADAQRRDYTHAERSLKASLRLTPDFTPAACTLARVYLRMGRRSDAADLLTELRIRHPESHQVLSTSGEIAYQEGRYPEAIQLYKSAIERSPSTARYHAELARVALDANRLSEAITAAQQAVQLAPDNSDFQGILGLAYEYSGLDVQAESAYRIALALDPENALALVKLGFRNQEGDPRTAGRTSGLTFAQGFLYDPAISNELLRGGINSEVTVGGGHPGNAEELAFRSPADAGRARLYSRGNRGSEIATRPNSDDTAYVARGEITFVPAAQSNLYGHAFFQDDDRGLPGQESAPVLDDRRRFQFGEYILGYRYRFSDKNHLWAGLFGNAQRDTIRNPDSNASLTLPGISFFGIPISVPESKIDSRARDFELRLDTDLGSSRDRPSVLTLGLALPTTDADYRSDLFLASAHYPDPISDPDNTGVLTEHRAFRTNLLYAQWARRTGDKLWFTAQVRNQCIQASFERSFREVTGTTLGALGDLSTSPPSRDETRLLPSVAVNYVPNPRTLVRLSASSRMTDITSSIFVPTETLLSTEDILPIGLPDTSRTLELDYQRYMSPGETLKLFAFRSTAENDAYDFGGFSSMGELDLGQVRRSGLGARYERRLQRYLYGEVGLVCSGTKCDAPGTAWDGDTAPYQPGVVGDLRLNYVDTQGTKLGLAISYLSRFFQDTGEASSGPRPAFPATVRVDVTLAKEKDVRNEYFLQVLNAFNARQIVFNDIPIGERTWMIGWTHRR